MYHVFVKSGGIAISTIDRHMASKDDGRDVTHISDYSYQLFLLLYTFAKSTSLNMQLTDPHARVWEFFSRFRVPSIRQRHT